MLTLEKRKQILDITKGMTKADIVEVSHILKQEYRNIVESEVRPFNVGDKVTFKDRAGKLWAGIVVKFNTKTVGVNCGGNRPWRVPPSCLTKIS